MQVHEKRARLIGKQLRHKRYKTMKFGCPGLASSLTTNTVVKEHIARSQ